MTTTDRAALLSEAAYLGVEHPKNIGTKRLAGLVAERKAAITTGQLDADPRNASSTPDVAPAAPTQPPPAPTAPIVPPPLAMRTTPASPDNFDNDPTQPAPKLPPTPSQHTDPREAAEAHQHTSIGFNIRRLRGTDDKPQRRNKWRETNGNPPPSRKGFYDPATGWLIESTGDRAPGGGFICTAYCPACDHGVIYGDAANPPGSICEGRQRQCRERIPHIQMPA